MPLEIQTGTGQRLERIPDILRLELPDVPPASVEDVVDTVTQELREEATTEDVVPVLVDRHSRERLRANAAPRRQLRQQYAHGRAHDRRDVRHGRTRRRGAAA